MCLIILLKIGSLLKKKKKVCLVLIYIDSVYFDPHWALPHGNVCTVRVCTGVHKSGKYFNRRAGTCDPPKYPSFGGGYTPFNYTSRDGGRQRKGLLGGAR